jgi:hypothetical protein
MKEITSTFERMSTPYYEQHQQGGIMSSSSSSSTTTSCVARCNLHPETL